MRRLSAPLLGCARRPPPPRRLLPHARWSLRSDRALSTAATPRQLPQDGKTLADFIASSTTSTSTSPSSSSSAPSPPLHPSSSPTLHVGVDSDDSVSPCLSPPLSSSSSSSSPSPHSYHLETYGCAMNTSDSEIVESILQSAGMRRAADPSSASIIAVNTCAIRENAEDKVWQRLFYFRALRSPSPHSKHRRSSPSPPPSRPLVVVLGCMAERLKDRLLDHGGLVDIVVGPDAYRDLPRLIDSVSPSSSSPSSPTAMNVQLSLDETYADITPVRASSSSLSAYVSIMRGCDNLCSYCVVPFTRGHERSRPPLSIVDEVRQLSAAGYKEVTLLGQNVNSYNHTHDHRLAPTRAARTAGFVNISRRPMAEFDFTDLLDAVSRVDPEMRVRYTSPHPKDVPTEMLQLIRERPNLCKQIHLPAQSGSSSVLQRMRRGYTREAYLRLISEVRELLPSASVSTDIIAGFCGETEEEHRYTVSLMEEVAYDQAFMFAYSEREKTHAHRTMRDDVPQDVKLRRLQEVIDTFHSSIRQRNQSLVGSVQLLLVEGPHRRFVNHLVGRTDGNRQAAFPAAPLPCYHSPVDHAAQQQWRVPEAGDYVAVVVESASSVSFRCRGLGWTTLSDFYRTHSNAAATRIVQPLTSPSPSPPALLLPMEHVSAVQLQ